MNYERLLVYGSVKLNFMMPAVECVKKTVHQPWW